MKVGILTWSKALNHGAILQAYSMQRVLADYYNIDSVILDYIPDHTEDYNKKLCNRINRVVKRLDIEHLKEKKQSNGWNKEKEDKFNSFKKEYCKFGDLYSKESGMDKVLIGSDMVFDIYQGYNPFMYGKNVNCDYLVAYSACFGYTTENMLLNSPHLNEMKELINKFKAISVRDDNTSSILEKVFDCKRLKKTADPVMLYGFNKEREIWHDNHFNLPKYILIYSYTYNMDKKDEVNEIKKFAQKHNLIIVSVGYIHYWADYSINASPKEFIELFSNAEYIITDTFHGTIFSLTFNKQFSVVVRNNGFKVIDILKTVGLENIAKGSIEQKLNNMVNTPINYVEVNKKIDVLNNNSKMFINEHIANKNSI